MLNTFDIGQTEFVVYDGFEVTELIGLEACASGALKADDVCVARV